MRQSLLDQLESLANEQSLQEIESIFDDESLSVNTNATSLNSRDPKSFLTVTGNMLESGAHTSLVLDCLEDMLVHENAALEKALESFSNDLLASVPMNTLKCEVFPLIPFKGISKPAKHTCSCMTSKSSHSPKRR